MALLSGAAAGAVIRSCWWRCPLELLLAMSSGAPAAGAVLRTCCRRCHQELLLLALSSGAAAVAVIGNCCCWRCHVPVSKAEAAVAA